MELRTTLKCSTPRVITAALSGGAGKTLITVGLIGALRRRGMLVGAFKKGPDYIDAGWLGLASREACYNLDTYLFPEEIVRGSFVRRSLGKQISVVEGNRGLFDGVNPEGGYSTAELAKLLRAPVVLIVDASKVTRTAAALVLGCREFDKDLNVAAVILNRVAGSRHERILRQSIEAATAIPVMGSVRKLAAKNLPQRHLGLLPLHEHPGALQFIEDAANLIEESVDVENLLTVAASAVPVEALSTCPKDMVGAGVTLPTVRIGIVRDSAFQFYYPENVEALLETGAEMVEISALEEKPLPRIDALYIGGGFPETHAEALAGNRVFKKSLREEVSAGLPVYAECGGLMYLCRNLLIDGMSYPMAGVFSMDAVLERKPQGLGYVQVEVTYPNPFYPCGAVLTGHEFHYSSIQGLDDSSVSWAFRVLRGHGVDGIRDGACRLNAFGTYVHMHALGESLWAKGLINAALDYHATRTNRPAAV
ncbi:MAG: cobyrinate a,c-diamide synthase [Desulfomonilaceae bacterium]|nr:cobyrinate a,c-diamide synthase [Desulfomonilaceae bacterium]